MGTLIGWALGWAGLELLGIHLPIWFCLMMLAFQLFMAEMLPQMK